jgi:hypothetical protein
VIPTFFDLRTGKTAKGDDMSVFWWTEGNGSCDCSRAAAFGIEDDMDAQQRRDRAELKEWQSFCHGCLRFIAVDVEGDLNSYDYEGNDPQLQTKEQVLIAMNSGYGRHYS